jgi:hypothetical protein
VYTCPLEQMCRDLARSLVLVFLCEHYLGRYERDKLNGFNVIKALIQKIQLSSNSCQFFCLKYEELCSLHASPASYYPVLRPCRRRRDFLPKRQLDYTSYISDFITLSKPQISLKCVLLPNVRKPALELC